MPLLPLEEFFRNKCEATPTELPHHSRNYFAQYLQILNALQCDYYPVVDAGLATNSTPPGLYTAHDCVHFDEVVIQAGSLIGIEANNCCDSITTLPRLSAYELYVLLVAIRIHDVGNMYGRGEHEKRCFYILRNLGDAAGSHDPEKKMIANIAEAHGGKTGDGSKDTIALLNSVDDFGQSTVRSRLLAGIVRIADEICENKRRAASKLLASNAVPKHNEIYHKYAESITSNKWEPTARTLRLKFNPRIEDLSRMWGCEERLTKTNTVSEVHLFDEIVSRLAKMDQERRYCNRFTRDLFTIDCIRAAIEVVDKDQSVVQVVPIELQDIGYPDSSETVRVRQGLENYCKSAYWIEKEARNG